MQTHPDSPAWAEPVTDIASTRGRPCEFCGQPWRRGDAPAADLIQSAGTLHLRHSFDCVALMVNRALDDVFFADPRLTWPWIIA